MTESETSPRRARARNARPKIERAALKLFIDEGVDAATTRHIAEEAGVSEGALYRHYKGKDQLALSLFMDMHNRISELIMEAAAKPGTMEERVRAVIEAYCTAADEDWLLFSFHLVSLDRFLKHDTKRDDDPVSLIEAVIADLMKSGDLPEGDPPIIASMCLGVVMQSAQNKIYHRWTGAFSAHIDVFTRAIMAILLQK